MVLARVHNTVLVQDVNQKWIERSWDARNKRYDELNKQQCDHSSPDKWAAMGISSWDK